MRQRSVERVSQKLGLQAEPCVLHRLFDVDSLQGQRYFFEDRFHAARFDCQRVCRTGADIDRDQPENGGFRTHHPHQPDVLR